MKSKIIKSKFYIETLGCNKNTVDSEIITSLLAKKGVIQTKDPEEAEYLIVNTCGFIDSAKEETIDTIFSLAQYKNTGKKKKLFVTGCFSQLYYNILEKEIPEIDAIFGVGNLEKIIDAITDESGSINGVCKDSLNVEPVYREYNLDKRLISTSGFAYVKIAEGCNRKCSFCLIPKIRGRFRSRRIEDIVSEIINLERSGIYEIILVSQDTLSYGHDLKLSNGLRLLLEEILDKTGIKLIRLLYLRPSEDLLSILDLFKDDRVIPYFDIPVQHVNDKILRSMRREGSRDIYTNLIEKIRNSVDNPVVRTSLIVGFPGEGEKEFDELLDFVREVRFNHLGVFTFSPQEGTEAYNLKGEVPEDIAEERKKIVLELQSKISEELLKRDVGKVVDVLVEEKVKGENIYFGRDYHFAPEVDGVFVIHSHKKIKVPSLVKCRITKAETYDLHGVPV